MLLAQRELAIYLLSHSQQRNMQFLGELPPGRSIGRGKEHGVGR
jgi:hypothetical protein